MIGWVTAAHKDGRRRLAKRHLKVEANERRRDMSLWDRRTADDRKLASKTAEQKQKAPSYAHELADCKRGIAFAYGGVFPGTLHQVLLIGGDEENCIGAMTFVRTATLKKFDGDRTRVDQRK